MQSTDSHDLGAFLFAIDPWDNQPWWARCPHCDSPFTRYEYVKDGGCYRLAQFCEQGCNRALGTDQQLRAAHAAHRAEQRAA